MKTKTYSLILAFLLMVGFVHATDLNATQKKAIAWAATVPLTENTTVKSLGAALGSVSDDEYTKALTIYCWLSKNLSYDYDSYESWKKAQPMAAQDPSSVLQRHTAVCQGYAELYKAICTEVGLRCELITGYAKGASYSPGNYFTGTNHAWNAVMIYGKWELMDVTWGDCLELNGIPDFFFFCASPSQLIASHLPKDSKWQLRTRPWTISTFESNPVCSSYFQMAFEGYSPKSLFIQRSTSPLQIKLKHGDPATLLCWASFEPDGSKEYIYLEIETQVTDYGLLLTIDLDPNLSGTLHILAGHNWGEQLEVLSYRVEGQTMDETASLL